MVRSRFMRPAEPGTVLSPVQFVEPGGSYSCLPILQENKWNALPKSCSESETELRLEPKPCL